MAQGSLYNSIDLEDTVDPALSVSGGDPAPRSHGFRGQLYRWCRARGLPLPDLHGHEWARALPEGVRFLDQLRVRHVLGVEFKSSRHEALPQRSKAWFAVEAADVVVHLTVLVLLPLGFATYALNSQRR